MFIKSNEKKEKSIVELVVEVSADEFNSALNDVFRKNRAQISVPGFRKGKAPRKIIETMYGATIFHSDAFEIILPKVFEHIGEEQDLRPIGQPNVTDINVDKDEGWVDINIEVVTYPDVTIGEYRGLSAIMPAVDVPEESVDREIEEIRLRSARQEKTDRPAINGDLAIVDYDAYLDGMPFDGSNKEDCELVLGSGGFIPEFEEKVVGMAVGEERDFDIVFPEDYSSELAGKTVAFTVKLKELRERILPDVDDEFAKDVSEFDTLEEYRASIRQKLLESMQIYADQAYEGALIGEITKSMEVDIPDLMIETRLNNAYNQAIQQATAYGMDLATYLKLSNTTPEAFRERLRASCIKELKAALALAKIAELEGIEISEEELEDEYKDATARYKMELDQLKEEVSPEEMTNECKSRRALKIVKESATALEPPEDGASEMAPPDEDLAVEIEPPDEDLAVEVEPPDEDATVEIEPQNLGGYEQHNSETAE